MPPSRSKGRERQCGSSPPVTYARGSSSSSSRTTSSGNSPPQTIGEFTPPRKPAEKDSSMRGSYGSPTTLTHGTSPNCASTPKIPPSRQANQDLKEDLSPDSIPPSQNYFDALSEEQDVHPEGLGRREPPRAQGASAPCQRQMEKAPMSIQEQEAEWEETDL